MKLLSRLSILCVAFVPAVFAAQGPGNSYEMRWGEPVDVELHDLSFSATQYEKRNVRTTGTLEFLDRPYLQLADGGARVVIIPVRENQHEIDTMIGKELEVSGVVRELKAPQEDYCQRGHWSICEEPNLPRLPDLDGARSFWPKVSLTVWSFTDLTDTRKKERAQANTATLEQLVSTPGRRDGQTLRVVGQFRGRNLFGDLPVRSQRSSADWVIKDDVFAVWVTGRKPKGDGFELDAGLKRDTGKWIEVVGRVETRNGITYVRAVKVGLSSPPTPTSQAQAPAPPPERPKVPPSVVFSLPLDGEADVPTNARFVVQFNKDMKEETFQGRVVLRYAGPALPGDRNFEGLKLQYDGGRRALTVDPGDRLRPGRQVELLLLSGIVDTEGLELTARPGRYVAGAVDVLRFYTGT